MLVNDLISLCPLAVTKELNILVTTTTIALIKVNATAYLTKKLSLLTLSPRHLTNIRS